MTRYLLAETESAPAAGVFEAMHDRLRQQWRDCLGRAPQPTAAVIDAQSTRSTAQGGNTGFDAGKKVKGRKRHLVVDTLGLLLAVTITAASAVIVRQPGNRCTGIWQDTQPPLWPEVVAMGFVVQTKRWLVEQARAWNERARRLMAHHDRSNWAPLAWVWLAEARILATRLAL